MQNQELHDEEREVLLSIYDGDPSFKQLSPTSYQYKYGEDGDPKSFILEIKWGDKYPEEIPTINTDMFYNKHLLPNVRAYIAAEVAKEAQNNAGEAMTFSLFEWVKEKASELIVSQPEITLTEAVNKVTISDPQETEGTQGGTSSRKPVKKELLSKSQKRKQWDRVDKGGGGERPRGFDWVDVIKHLSQTGGKDCSDSATPAT